MVDVQVTYKHTENFVADFADPGSEQVAFNLKDYCNTDLFLLITFCFLSKSWQFIMSFLHMISRLASYFFVHLFIGYWFSLVFF